MRLPAVAGQFYPGNAAELKHQLEDMLPQAEEMAVLGGSSSACRIYLFRTCCRRSLFSPAEKRDLCDSGSQSSRTRLTRCSLP